MSLLSEKERQTLANRTRRLMASDVVRHVFGQSRLTINISRMLSDGLTVIFCVPSGNMEATFCRNMLMSGGYELMFPHAVWSVGFVVESGNDQGSNQGDAQGDDGAKGTGETGEASTGNRPTSEKMSIAIRQAKEAGYTRPVAEVDEEIRRRTLMIDEGDIAGLSAMYAYGMDETFAGGTTL